MGNVLCVEPTQTKSPSDDILFYEVTPKPSSQSDPLSHSHHQIEELVTSAEIEGAKNGDHRDLFSTSAGSSTIDTNATRRTMTASSTSSFTIDTTNMSEKDGNLTQVLFSSSVEETFQEEEKQQVESEEATNVIGNMLDDMNLEDEHADALDVLGVSVYHFENVLYPQFLKAGHTHSSKVYIVENLRNASHGFSSIIRDKGKNAFCPLDGQRGASYVHALLHDTESSASKQYAAQSSEPDVVGPANFMISYSWDYAIGDILDTVTTYCDVNNLNKKSTYMWMDCLCINLHRIVELKKKELESSVEDDYSQDEKKNNVGDISRQTKKNDVISIFASSDELESTMRHRIKEIGHLLAIMTPFHQPTYLSRLWCLYEMGIANADPYRKPDELPCKITIAIPPQQKELLVASIETDTINTINKLYELVNVDISAAGTTVEEDTEFILDLIQHGQPQRPRSRNNDRYHGYHNMMKDLIRGWVTNLITSGIEEKTRIYMDEHNDGNIDFDFEEWKTKTTTFAEEELANFYNYAAYALRKNNEFEHSLELYKKSVRIKEALLVLLQGEENNDWAETLANAHGDSREKQASSSIATTYNNIAIALYNLGELDEAMAMLQKCLEIREVVLGADSTTTASTYNSISEILQEKGQLGEALEMNMKCLETFQAVMGNDHPSTATIYDSIASQLQSMGQLDEAMVMYRKALTIKEAELGYHSNTAKSYASIASLLEDKGEIEDALRMYKKCVKIQEVAIGPTHPSTAATYNNIARILHGLGKKEEALQTWNKALVVLKENIGPDHTQVLVQALVEKLGNR